MIKTWTTKYPSISRVHKHNAMAEPARERREMKARRMSNYGVKSYTPEQTKEQWRESMRVCNVSCILTTSRPVYQFLSFFFFLLVCIITAILLFAKMSWSIYKTCNICCKSITSFRKRKTLSTESCYGCILFLQQNIMLPTLQVNRKWVAIEMNVFSHSFVQSIFLPSNSFTGNENK